MTDREKLARQWAEDLKDGVYGSFDDESSAAAEYILEHTDPPTMADVDWDDEEHHLAGATTSGGYEVAMIRRSDSDDDLIITDRGEYSCGWLTPNGKRYELREVTKPDHPEYLETVEDYTKAPHGTIVTGSEVLDVLVKNLDQWWADGTCYEPEGLAGRRRTVRRWGKGGEA